jgi:hypothetical protein
MTMNRKESGLMAVDQYGGTIHLTGCKHPRKALLETSGRKHAAKMYVDTADGQTKHVGYIIAGCWYTLYRVSEWEGKATQ